MIVLDKSKYLKVRIALNEVGINNLFARAVVEGHVNGTVNVDNAENPTSFYVRHPYGMSLLFGVTTNQVFNSWLFAHALNLFRTRDRFEWLQAYPEKWNEQIATQWQEYLIKAEENTEGINTLVEVNTRVNFKFNKEVRADAAQGKARLTPHQVSLLHVGKRKGLVAFFRGVDKLLFDRNVDFTQRGGKICQPGLIKQVA